MINPWKCGCFLCSREWVLTFFKAELHHVIHLFRSLKLRTGHEMPGNLPIPVGHFSANVGTGPYCHSCKVQTPLVYLSQLVRKVQWSNLNAIYWLAILVFPMGKYPPIPWPFLVSYQNSSNREILGDKNYVLLLLFSPWGPKQWEPCNRIQDFYDNNCHNCGLSTEFCYQWGWNVIKCILEGKGMCCSFYWYFAITKFSPTVHLGIKCPVRKETRSNTWNCTIFI